MGAISDDNQKPDVDFPLKPHKLPLAHPEKKISVLALFLIPLLLLVFGSVVILILSNLLGLSIRWNIALIQTFSVIIPTLIFLKFYGLSIRKVTAWQWPKLLPMSGALLFLAGLIVFSDAVLIRLLEIVPEGIANHFKNLLLYQKEIMDIHHWYQYLWFFLIVVLGAGIFEELLFRGLILKATMQRTSLAAAVVLNGILFAVMHMNILAFGYYFLLGAVLAFIAVHSKTLIYCIILHCTLNFSVLVVSRYFDPLEPIPVHPLVSYCAAPAAMTLGIILFVKTVNKKKPKNYSKTHPVSF